MDPLIVVIPGIGGSILADDDGNTVYTVDAPTALTCCLNPDELDMARSLHPVGLIPTFGVCHPLLITGYDRIMDRLTQVLGLSQAEVATARPHDPQPVRPDASLVAFPYDFRRSVAHNAEVLDREIRRRAQGRPVVLVAHSMGGLVAASWWANLSDGIEVREIMTLGTPYRGATKALEVLVNGASARGLPLPGSFNRVLRGWDSVFDLLPHWKAVEDGTGQLYPYQVAQAVPGFQARAEAAYQANCALHQELEAKAASTSGNPFNIYYTQGIPTLCRAVLTGNRLRTKKADLPGLGASRRGGDGTVPMISVIPDFLEGRPDSWHRLKSKHSELMEEGAVDGHVAGYGMEPLPAAIRGDADRPEAYLSIDLDDVVPAGQPQTVRIAIEDASGEALGASDLRVFLTSTGEVSVETDGEAWVAQTPPLKAGVHRLRATAAGVSGGLDLEETVRVGVVPCPSE